MEKIVQIEPGQTKVVDGFKITNEGSETVHCDFKSGKKSISYCKDEVWRRENLKNSGGS